MNRFVTIHHTKNAEIEVEKLLNIRAFDLNKTLELDPHFLQGEKPFEWGGLYQLDAGAYELALEAGPDPSMKMTFIPTANCSHHEFHHMEHHAEELFSTEPEIKASGSTITPALKLFCLSIGKNGAKFPVTIEKNGSYGILTEHGPEEFKMTLRKGAQIVHADFFEEFTSHHEHDHSISSVGIDCQGNLNPEKFNLWLSKLLQNKGADIFRMKGIVSIEGELNQFVFQAVHMIFDGQPDKPWGSRPRRNQLVFIGRNLDRESLNRDFKSCLA